MTSDVDLTERPATRLLFEALRATAVGPEARVSIDDEGGAPLRCCLRDSRPGERIALVAVTPDGPLGAYRETGPVFVHADPCPGPGQTGYPEDWRRRTQVFRAYDRAGSIVGGAVVPPGQGQEEAARELLRDPSVAFLQTRNVVFGCYMLTIRRAQRPRPGHRPERARGGEAGVLVLLHGGAALLGVGDLPQELVAALGSRRVLLHDLAEEARDVVQPGVLRIPDVLPVVVPGLERVVLDGDQVVGDVLEAGLTGGHGPSSGSGGADDLRISR
jgi:Protein of unknown function (DUF1203)